jgi:hypothetical protein
MSSFKREGLFFFFGGTGISTQNFTFVKQALYCLSHNSSLFHLVLVVWKMGSLELFALAGLILRST